MHLRVFSVLVITALLSSFQPTFAAPRFRCSVQPNAAVVAAGRERGIDNIAVFGDECSGTTVQAIAIANANGASASASAFASASTGGGTVPTSAVATSDDFRPFEVAGGDDGVEIEERGESVTIVDNVDRPVGPWTLLIESDVHVLANEAWIKMQNFGNVLVYGLDGFGVDIHSLESKGKKWSVDLGHGENIIFTVITTDNAKFFHVVNIDSHTSNVFPGVHVAGSQIFIQFRPISDDTTMIEFGWGGNFNGDIDVAIIQLGSFGQNLLENLENKFGTKCEDAKNIRTIEGDCNNLNDPRRGAAGHALVRLGGPDPAFPNGDPTKPSGPSFISPREISNRLCAQSPGSEIVESNSHALQGECYNAQSGNGDRWTICPYKSAQRHSSSRDVTLSWEGTTSYDDGTVSVVFDSDSCHLELLLSCHGASLVELDDNPCGSSGNRLYHPIACRIRPGEDDVLKSDRDLTDLFWTFGQFIDHDLDLTPVTQIVDKKQPGFTKLKREEDAEELPIKVPNNDYYFRKEKELEFERTTLLTDRSRGLHENKHSAFADLGQVYGADFLRARALRSFEGGKLKTIPGDLPPYNKIDGFGALRAKLDNAPDADDKFFAFGDVRGNEQTLLLAMHIVWIREHNHVCDELAIAFPSWSDERLYQTARQICIAEYQSIVYDEWLPMLLGEGVCPSGAYSYDSNVDPSIAAIFSTAAFRFGHTMVGSFLWQLGPGSKETANLELVPLRDAFFKPELIERYGVDDFMRGAAWHVCKKVDNKVVDELRNFLFTKNPNKGHMDLMSLNIQRGRDIGLPTFNDVRSLYGLPPHPSFFDFIDDDHLASASEHVYGTVDICDPIYGGFAEKTFPGSLLGETFHTVVKDQFTKIRDGDRFFFKGLQWDPIITGKYPRINDIMAGKVKLADVLVRNTGVTYDELGHRGSTTIFKL